MRSMYTVRLALSSVSMHNRSSSCQLEEKKFRSRLHGPFRKPLRLSFIINVADESVSRPQKRFLKRLKSSFMPKRKNKKTLYLDTNVILDLLLKRSNEAVVLVESVKSRRWGVITSTLSLVEMSDWKKRDLFMRNKVELFWSMDSILSKKNETDLGENEFRKVEKWLLDSAVSFKPDYYDLADAAGWLKLREISTSTNLLAKDAMQFCTALIAALNGKCNFFVTSDGNLIKEAKGYLRKNRLKGKLDVLTPREFAKLYPPHRN